MIFPERRDSYMEEHLQSRRIGILGGSFDPIHQGHINIAINARSEFSLEEIWFVPAGHSPNKDECDMTSAEDRARMVELAIAAYPFFRLSRIELDSEEKSYTCRTLEKLTAQYPGDRFYFIMGADSLDYFEEWFHPELICEKAVILVAVRDDLDLTQIEEKIRFIKRLFPAEIYPVRGGRTEISSTELRKRISEQGNRQTERPDACLPECVWRYIKEQGLYGSKSHGAE